MNRNILKWVLIAAVIIGAAAYFILSEMPSGQRQGKQGKEKIVVGNSKAFEIEPIEGITISAVENALDKDRKIEVSPVDDKTWDKLESTIAEVSGMQMILGLKVSAGLKAGESTPGVITCQYDLKKMGIPEILYDYITVWHVGEDGDAYKYTSWMEGDRLTFHTDQNPFITLAVPSLAAVGTTLAITVVAAPFLIYGGETVMKYLSNSDLYSYYFFENSDAAIYNVKDKYGDFHILFRFRDTEEANRHDEFVAANEKAVIRLKELSTLAKKEYDRKVDSLYAIEMKKMKDVWSRLVQSSAAYERSKAAIDQAAIFVKKQKEDAEYQLLLKKMQPPKSIADIGEMLKAANRFLTKDQLMKPQTRDLEVDLIDAAHAGTSNAEYRHGLTKSPYMIVKYDKKKPGAQYSRFGDSANESLLISVNHELFHHREKIMKFMDFRTEETFAAYNEKVASAYFREHNELTLPDNDLNFAPRTDHQAYCMSFSSKYFGKPHLAYVYANLMDSLQVYTKSKSIKGSKLMDRYSYLSSYKSNYMSWFSIKDEALFEDYLMRFFKGSLEWIATAQQNNVAETPELKRQECIVSKDKPIQKIDAAKGDYIMRAVDIQTKVMANNPDEAFNAFIIPESGYKKGELRFCWNFGQGVAQESMYLSNGTQGDNFYQLGYFKIPSGKRIFTVVVLFKPEAPEIRKVKEDQVTFIVPKPARSLTKEKLITGVVVTYKDKNGEELTREIEPKNFGKKATWTIPGCSKKGNSFTLSAHWYYKPDEQTTYVSPESEPAQWGAKGDEPEEEEMVLTKEPETNYWKQVSSRMTMKNTSIDVDESNDDEVSSDYRSIDLQAAKTGRSLEFSGMGATEEKTKENGRVYVQDIFIEGTLTYTEPPKFWIPTQQYKAHWEIADDPYLTKVSDPFVFEAKNTSSDQAACAQSKKDKIDNGRSSVGKVNWLRGSTTTFEARHPEKNGPKSFTLTQTYSIKERQGSDLMATVTFVYNYEWVGEEEPEVEEETVPEGGYWQLVKTEVDDSKISAQGVGKNLTYNNYIEGKDGVYLVHGECGYEKYWKKPLIKVTHERTIKTERPKKIYTPGETIRLKIQYGATKITPTDEPNAKNVIHGHSVANFDYGCTDVPSYEGSFEWEQEGATYTGPGTTGTAGEDCRTRIAPTKGYGWTGNTFLIIETVRSSTGNTVELKITYHYEWVDGGKKAKPVKEPAKEKPITGGHWKLIHTGVSTEQGMITGSAKGITIQGSNGHYTAHVERDGMISDREINFEKPKSVYMPGEEITLKVTNEKPKIKGGKEGMSYGDIVFSTGHWDGCVEYKGDRPSYSNKKVVGVAKGSAPSKPGTPGAVGFFITEYIKVYGSMSKISTTYNYAWEE